MEKMNSFYGRNRLRIADYSSELKATIDIHVETYIEKNHHYQLQVDKANKAREEWVKEIDECEVDNLAELEKRKDRDLDLEDETLLKRFCFVFKFRSYYVHETGSFTWPLAWRLISTDKFMSPDQIACIQMMIECAEFDSDDVETVRRSQINSRSLDLLFDNDNKELSYCSLSVKNNNLSATNLIRNLDLVKIAGEKLFSFTEAELKFTTIQSVRDRAVFLFTQLTSIRLKLNNNRDNYQPSCLSDAKRIIKSFKKVGKLKFVALGFTYGDGLDLNLIDRELLTQINGLEFHSIKLNGNSTLEEMYLCGDERNANSSLVPGTTALTELNLIDCEMVDIDVRRLADFFPRLEKLHMRPKPDLIRKTVILTNDPFRTMNNMRVLKLDKVAVHSFEILDGGCMPNLEDLYVRFTDDLDSLTRIESFPNFPKLAKLNLRLTGVKWIDPRAFDHLKQLIKFNIVCRELVDDKFETGAVARFMSFHVNCRLVKLTSGSVSRIEEIEIYNHNEKKTTSLEKTSLETIVPLSGLKRLTMLTWTNANLPFHQMTNLEYVHVTTNDLSIINSGHFKYLSKLRVLTVENSDQETPADSCPDHVKLSSELLSSSLKQLTVIGFKNLSSIDSGIFQHLPHLEKLCLANNAIERTESGSLDHLNTPEKSLNTFCFDKPHPGVQCRLKELNFTGNQFGCILKRSISHLPTSLSKLNLCNNKIVDIESGAFENMVNLRFLNLAWNLYETLDLNNILHRDTAYILYLHIESNMKSLMMWNDLSEQKEDGVSSIAMKREQRGISSFPMRKFFQHPVFVTVSEIQHEANRVVFNKMVDDGLIFISAACYYIP